MNELAMKIKQPKRRCEWVELRFMAAAAEHDLHATKPGETPRNTTSYSNTMAASSASRSSQRNSKIAAPIHALSTAAANVPIPDAAFDFLAVYVVPEDAWYIIPAHAFRGQASVCLRPSQARSKYGKYLAAWDLMKGGPTASPDSTSPTEVTCV
jgi:hypothetical protein